LIPCERSGRSYGTLSLLAASQRAEARDNVGCSSGWVTRNWCGSALTEARCLISQPIRTTCRLRVRILYSTKTGANDRASPFIIGAEHLLYFREDVAFVYPLRPVDRRSGGLRRAGNLPAVARAQPIVIALFFVAFVTGSALESAHGAQSGTATTGVAPTQGSSSAPEPPQASSSSKPRAPSPGISAYEGLPIRAIEMPGVAPEDAAHMIAATPLKPGEPLTRQALHDAIQALFASGRFADIQAEAERSDNGVTVRFVTASNYFVGLVAVDGVTTDPTPNQLITASRLKLGELYTQEKLEHATENIRRVLEENGFHRSNVTSSEQTDTVQQQKNIFFHVTPGPRAKVGQIKLEGETGYSQVELEEIAHFHAGDPVISSRLTRALQKIRSKYQKQERLLAQVSVASRTYRPEKNAVDYTFRIDRGPVVLISTEGYMIRRGVFKKLVPIYEEGAVDEDLLNEGRKNLQNYLESIGYFDAKVNVNQHTVEDGSQVQVVYVIDPGPRHRLAAIEITGNKLFDEDLIRSRMQEQAAGRFGAHGKYSEALLANDVSSIEDLYRSNGYLQAKVTIRVLDKYHGDPYQLALVVNVVEGPQTRVAWVRIEGNYSIPSEQILPLSTEEGQGFDEGNLSDDRDKILGKYFNNGFPNATLDVNYVPVEPSAGGFPRVGVTLAVTEGEQFFVNRVYMTGLHYTRSGVARREWKIHPSAPLSQQDMLETQRGLYSLGLFNEVDTAVQNPDGTESRKNVLVAVREAKRYTFDYGAGFEFQTGQPSVGTNQPLGQTGVSPKVLLGVTRINVGGRDQTVSAKTTLSRLQQLGLVSFSAPKLMSRDLTFTATGLYDNTIDVSTFTSERLQGTGQIVQVLKRSQADDRVLTSMSYSFSYRRVKASNIEVTQNLIPLLSSPTRVGMPSILYIRNKRDDDLETTKGNYTTIEAGAAASYFGSEADFSRALVKNATYHAFLRNRRTGQGFVFARAITIGLENPFGNTVVIGPSQTAPANHTLIPLPERLFSGGGNSHRGFGLNQAGPRDPFTGFPVGGSALFLNNLELRFPNLTLPYLRENIGFTFFHDMGNVFDTPQHMVSSIVRWHQSNPQVCFHEPTHLQCSYNYLSHAIGLGVRYKTPIGPLRFDFGYNLNPPVFPSYTNITINKINHIETGQFGTQRAGHFNFSFTVGQSF
jgi:outer membrane protein insertion porin family